MDSPAAAVYNHFIIYPKPNVRILSPLHAWHTVRKYVQASGGVSSNVYL